MKKSPRSVLLAILVTVVLVGAPLAYFLNAEKLKTRDLSYENDRMTAQLAAAEEAAKSGTGEMLFYDLNGLDLASATSKEVAFTDLFTAEDLNARATDCGTTVEANYFENLVAQFADVKGMQYSFAADAEGTEVYNVTVFPNAPKYKDLAAFAKDYMACSVGGTAAARMNENKLMFVGSCSAAYGETVPAMTCSDIKNKLVLEFN